MASSRDTGTAKWNTYPIPHLRTRHVDNSQYDGLHKLYNSSYTNTYTQGCKIITVVLCNNTMLKVLITLVNTGIVLTPHHGFHMSLGPFMWNKSLESSQRLVWETEVAVSPNTSCYWVIHSGIPTAMAHTKKKTLLWKSHVSRHGYSLQLSGEVCYSRCTFTDKLTLVRLAPLQVSTCNII